MKINIICKVCYAEMEAQFTADEINDEVNLFIVPCKQCAFQHSVQRTAGGLCSECGKQLMSDGDCAYCN